MFALINSLFRRYLCGITQQSKRNHCARSPLEVKQLVYQAKTTRAEANIQSRNEAWKHSIAQGSKHSIAQQGLETFNRPTRQTFNCPTRQTIQSPNEANIQLPNEANHSIAQRGKHSIAQRGKPFNRPTRKKYSNSLKVNNIDYRLIKWG